MPSSSADALLFDLSRVVIDIDFNRAFSRWAGHARCDQKLIRERFRHDDAAYKRHQRGEIDSEEFLANLRASLAIDISDAQLLDGWNSILVGEMPGVSELLAKAAGSFPLTPLPIPTANTSSTGQISFPAFSVISKRSTCRRRLG
jgi:glucose-1-phosphatase